MTFKDQGPLKFLHELFSIHRHSGFEVEASRLLKEYAESHCGRICSGKLGNTRYENAGEEGSNMLLAGHMAIVVDVDIAVDVPGIGPLQAPATMGGGISITYRTVARCPAPRGSW